VALTWWARATARHAIFLGGMVTFTHTISVFMLGFVTLFLSRYVAPEKISPVLEVIAQRVDCLDGAMLLYKRIRALNGHGNSHGHDHTLTQPRATATITTMGPWPQSCAGGRCHVGIVNHAGSKRRPGALSIGTDPVAGSCPVRSDRIGDGTAGCVQSRSGVRADAIGLGGDLRQAPSAGRVRRQASIQHFRLVLCWSRASCCAWVVIDRHFAGSDHPGRAAGLIVRLFTISQALVIWLDAKTTRTRDVRWIGFSLRSKSVI